MIYIHNHKDPLQELHEHYGFHPDYIKNYSSGSLYNFTETQNNEYGIASTLNSKPINIPATIDFNSLSHRSLYTAYLNALINTRCNCKDSNDLISEMNIDASEKIVMIGYFRPIINIFKNSIRNLSIFDDQNDDLIVLPSSLKNEKIKHADVLIITATSIINNSFCKEISLLSKNSRIYILGPSSIMSDYFKTEHKVVKIFGSQIVDTNSLKIAILQDKAPPCFSKFIDKVQY